MEKYEERDWNEDIIEDIKPEDARGYVKDCLKICADICDKADAKFA